LVGSPCIYRHQYCVIHTQPVLYKKEIPLKELLVVAVGGIIGSLARWSFTLVIPDNGFPWATLLINYLGSVLLASIVIYSNNHQSPKWWWRPALGSGFCGGFTTYSAFAVKIDQYLTAGNVAAASLYVAASFIGSYLLIIATSEFMNRNRLAQ
jgi:CrcB protein